VASCDESDAYLEWGGLGVKTELCCEGLLEKDKLEKKEKGVLYEGDLREAMLEFLMD
jgi:hypothetical protein